ncbi:DUF6519 domain-containing protein [Moorena sp. SIO3I6]|uniref:DUF6519 domain-containing protein n=1 Tax=Moorena sp. SIO3I6 TaxID=2607831 RepID=UPI0013F6D14C|nr:DUF6519 domain-containing protein [Moorena sp. SIO3I6]NEP25094.1 hypothetical protein [Moorena sp. SIO3I6]
MKGDFTRFTFNRNKHYSSVRMQQGRVLLDADWNEQLDISAYRDWTIAQDTIGLNGFPTDTQNGVLSNTSSSFQLKVLDNGSTLTIDKGHCYVDGIFCENDQEVEYTKQPDLPQVELDKTSGYYLAYLDVWQRHITIIEDPSIREEALGGPDTSTRTKTVWQAKLLKVEADINKELDNNTLSELWNNWVNVANNKGQLLARTPQGAGGSQANQLYRLEIHQSGELGQATFKWSRHNGAIAARIESIDSNRINIGGDSQAEFATGQWVEITDERNTLQGIPGIFVKLNNVQGDNLYVTEWPNNQPVTRESLGTIPTVRLWDSEQAITVTQPEGNEGYIQLNNDLEVKFESGNYTTGDYWLIPTRTSQTVEWSIDKANPHGISHHYSPLALLLCDGSKWELVEDRRAIFSPLTGVVSQSGGTMTGPLTIESALTVSDNVTLGNSDQDTVTIYGTVRSQHSSGSLRIADALNVSENLTVDGKVGIGTTQPGNYKLKVDGGDTHLNGAVTVSGNLEVEGNVTFRGDVIARDVDHQPGDVLLGDQDEDKITFHGTLRSQHSSGKLEIADALKVAEDLSVAGNVGIAIDTPEKKLHVEQGELRVRANHNEITADIGAFYAQNLSQGIGIGFNRIEAIGNNGSQDIVIRPKGTGQVIVDNSKLQVNGSQQIVFTDTNTSNNLKLQLWSGYGLGINGSTLFYAANGRHSWRDVSGTNERMALTTAADGGLSVLGTGNSSFGGNLRIAGITETPGLDVGGFSRSQHINKDGVFYRYNGQVYITVDDNLYIRDFNSAEDNSDNIRMHFNTNNGSLGINKTNPGANLDVNGNLKLQLGVAVNEFSNDGSLGGNNDLAVPTERAVKSYIDNQINQVDQRKANLAGSSEQDFQAKTLNVNQDLTVNGNVGIGTNANADARLSVQGDSILSGFVFLGNQDTDNIAIHGTVRSQHSSGALQVADALHVAENLSVDGNVTLGDTSKLQVNGNQQIVFTDINTSNNLKLQLWNGYGLGINGSTLFYAANGRHSWRDVSGSNERMVLTTAADGGLSVLGTGQSSFAGNLTIAGITQSQGGLNVDGNVTLGDTSKLQIHGSQQIVFTNTDLNNNLKLQLWGGYGLGINYQTLFYAADLKHSWRDLNGINERMALTTTANGGLSVLGTGQSSFAGNLTIAGITQTQGLDVSVQRTEHINKDGAFYRYGGQVYISVDDNLYIRDTGDSNNIKMHFNTNNGRLGINKTNPGANLDVNGNLKLKNGVAVNEFSNDQELKGNSDSAVPTEKAVKTYVDTKISQGVVAEGGTATRYQFSADRKFDGQNIKSSGTHVIEFVERNDPYKVFDDKSNAFIAPTSGYYFFAATLQFSGGNGNSDGVIMGIYKNGKTDDNNTTIIVIEPGLIKNSTAQSITAMMKLDPKDSVDVRLEGVDKSTFSVSYSSFMGFLIGQ